MEKFRRKITNIDKDLALDLAKFLDVDFAIGEALVAKGLTSAGLCGNETFHSPLLMAGMAMAVEKILSVAREGGSILIFGDYDADGISAASILKLFFDANAIDSDVVIPTREIGYGISIQLIEEFFLTKAFNLLLTVDCGISNAEEIQYLQSKLGIEVVVTDHHELPQILPNCICVNPKISYPYKYLSGSGVAFKLVEALSDLQTALNFADLAALGTIGDVMPLIDENRAIVKHGLANPTNRGLIKLAQECAVKIEKITCADFSLRICPKINAAGRIGCPQAALDLLLSSHRVNADIVKRLLQCNAERVEMTDKLNKEIQLLLSGKSPLNCVIVKNPDWNIGVIGIAANKLAEIYMLPSVVMTFDGDKWVGSARSDDSINLHGLFSKLDDYVIKFGGHSGAVGFSVEDKNLEQFIKAFEDACSELDRTYLPLQTFDVDFLPEYNSLIFLDKLSKIEPQHLSSKLIYRCKGGVKLASLFGGGQHLQFVLENGLGCKAFTNFSGYYNALKNNAECEIIFSLEVDSYTKTPVAIVKALNLLNSVKLEESYCANYLQNFSVRAQAKIINKDKLQEMLKIGSCLIVCNTYAEYEYIKTELDISNLPVDMFELDSFGCSRIIISPNKGQTENFFGNVIVISDYGLGLYPIFDAYVCKLTSNADFLFNCAVSRECITEVYRALKSNRNCHSFKDSFDKMILDNISYAQFLRVIRVLEQLEIIFVNETENVDLETGKSASLENSKLYLRYNMKNAG